MRIGTHMGTAALGGVCSTSAKATKAMPMRTSMTRKNRMRKGRQSLRGMHFGIAAAGCGGGSPAGEGCLSGGRELCQHSQERPRANPEADRPTPAAASAGPYVTRSKARSYGETDGEWGGGWRSCRTVHTGALRLRCCDKIIGC